MCCVFQEGDKGLLMKIVECVIALRSVGRKRGKDLGSVISVRIRTQKPDVVRLAEGSFKELKE